MCLNVVTKTCTLKKDMRVWKYMEIPAGCRVERTPYRQTKLNQHVNRCKSTGMLSCNIQGSKPYPAGFHCHLSEEDAQQHAYRFRCYFAIARPVILDYILPAGTTVTFGKSGYGTIVVTPILINPRIPEKTS